MVKAGKSKDRFAMEWATALSGVGHVPMSSPEVLDWLASTADRLTEIAASTPFRPQDAAEVGAALVGGHFVATGALGHSLTVIGRHLPRLLVDCPAPSRAERVRAVQEAVATGYVTALRDRTLAEQESIRRAEIEGRLRAEQARRGSEALFRAVFTDAAIGIVLAGVDQRLADVNPAFTAMLGRNREETLQLRVSDLTTRDQVPVVARTFDDLIQGDVASARMKARFLRTDGTEIWANLTASLIRDPYDEPAYVLCLLEDVSDRHALEERLRYQALHDPLTGLPNRTLFFDRLAEALRDGDARIGICYLDLDGFKGINDTLGHDVGDQLLVAVARRLERRSSRRYGGTVARMGGDEFVMLVQGSDGLAGMTALASDILARVEEPFQLGEHRLRVRASVGIVERPVAGTTAADVVKDADTALYWAKAEGRGRWAVFDPARKTRHASRLTLTAALDGGEYALLYQPVTGLADGQIIPDQVVPDQVVPDG